MKFIKKHVINGKLVVMTGMHIGGMKETFQIGGSDSPVIKIKDGKTKDGTPYVPGSSLKGKIRSLLEKSEGFVLSEGKKGIGICECGTCNICILFGCHSSKNTARCGVLIFRDGYTDKEKVTEIKAENVIHRVTGVAEHPRFIERVVPKTEFDIEIVYNEFEGDNKKELLEMLKKGFELLENDYLGGSGTRGYGKVDVKDIISKIGSIANGG